MAQSPRSADRTHRTGAIAVALAIVALFAFACDRRADDVGRASTTMGPQNDRSVAAVDVVVAPPPTPAVVALADEVSPTSATPSEPTRTDGGELDASTNDDCGRRRGERRRGRCLDRSQRIVDPWAAIERADAEARERASNPSP